MSVIRFCLKFTFGLFCLDQPQHVVSSDKNPGEIIEYRADSSIRSKEVFIYSTSGQLIEKTETHYSRKRLKWTAIYEYDNMGRIISINTYGADDKLKGAVAFEYDSGGNVIQRPGDNVQ